MGFSSVPDTDISVENTQDQLDGTVYSNSELISEIEENEVSLKPEEIGDKLVIEYTSNGIKYNHSISSEDFSIGDRIVIPERKSQNYLFHVNIGVRENDMNGSLTQEGRRLAELNKTGHAWISSNHVREGEFHFTGKANGTKYNFTFKLEKGENEHYQKNFYVTEEEWNNQILGGAANLELSELREYSREFINQARRNNHPGELPSNSSNSDFSYYHNPVSVEFSDALNRDAQSKVEEMREEDYYSHSSPSGISVGDRLKNDEVAYLMAAEDLTSVSNLSYDADERIVARAAINSFLNSPSHRSSIVDRDDLYTDVGIGYDCKGDNCLVAVVLAKMKTYASADLDEDYCWNVPIHEKGLGIDYPMDVEISMKTRGSLDSYLVPQKSEYDECINSDRIDSMKEWDRSSGFTHKTETEPGHHLIFKSNTDSDTSVKIDYTN